MSYGETDLGQYGYGESPADTEVEISVDFSFDDRLTQNFIKPAKSTEAQTLMIITNLSKTVIILRPTNANFQTVRLSPNRSFEINADGYDLGQIQNLQEKQRLQVEKRIK